MILLDTNTIIYLRNNQLSDNLIDVLRNSALNTCNIIVAEVLGYKDMDQEDESYFKDLFDNMKNHVFNKETTEKVIELRRTNNIKLPDAIIAATALVSNLVLWTHNTSDFANIPDLQLLDPLKS
jgi:predicted nucleic acid-binding protein